MSRLDQHVAFVQNKLAFSQFLSALSRTVAVAALLVLIAILVDRIFWVHPPAALYWIYGAIGLAAVVAVVIAMLRRPTAEQAAVKIDQVLNTQDKFATALHVRTSTDPFAHAALLDAENTAQSANLNNRFKIEFPKFAFITLLIIIAGFATNQWMDRLDLFGKRALAMKQQEQVARQDQAKKQLNAALVQVASVPKALAEDSAIKLARESVMAQLSNPNIDPERAQRTAAKALQDLNEAIKNQIKSNDKFVEAQSDAKMMKQLQTPDDEKGPVADASRSMAKGNFTDALNELNKVSQNFDKMDGEQQKKAADQMKKMANQLQQMAQGNPQQQQQMQQQLQQAGLNQQQAQQVQQQMQKAAQGDKQAQQQLQQMAQQAMKQMNNGQGPNQQQQQQIQQMMQQMQAQANGQQQAQQMAQAAKQMAQAMQQGQQQGQQGQQGQKQGGQQQQAQKQGGQQQGQQQGQGMQQAMQQMQQQMQQMAAAQQDAEQIAAAQQGAQQAAQDAMNQMNGQAGNNGKPGGNQGGNNWNNNPNNLQGNPNQQNQPWNGQGGKAGANPGGFGAGDRSYKAQAPYGVKKEVSPSIDDEKGRILASTLVKASAVKGDSKEQLKEVAKSASEDQAEEVDQDRVSRQAQGVVRDYFSSMQDDANGSAPATQPAK